MFYLGENVKAATIFTYFNFKELKFPIINTIFLRMKLLFEFVE